MNNDKVGELGPEYVEELVGLWEDLLQELNKHQGDYDAAVVHFSSGISACLLCGVPSAKRAASPTIALINHLDQRYIANRKEAN